MPSSVVKRKAQEADEMIRKLAAEAEGQDPNAQQSQDGDSEEPSEVDQESRPPLQAVDNHQELSDDSDDEPTSEHEVSPNEVAELKRQIEKADQRWRSLQGQIGSKDQQIEQLHQLLAKMDQTHAAPQQPETTQSVGISKDDIDAYGEDMIDLVRRVASQVASETVSQLQQSVTQLESQVGEVKEVSTKAASVGFEEALTKAFNGWEELNEDVGFIGWLQDRSARLRLFSEAAQSKDAASVAEFFQMYADKVGWKPKSATKQRKKEELTRQVSPGKGRTGSSSSAQSQPENETWTRSQIASLYANKSQYAADEFAKLERQAAKAMQDNRVDYSK